MKKILLTVALCCITAFFRAAATDTDFKDKQAGWLRKAEQAKPALTERIVRPVCLVTPVADESAYQGWRMDKVGEVADYQNSNINKMNDVIVDFGSHLTGYFTFKIKTVKGVQDAPIRIKFTFGEVPSEMATPFDPFPGSLSRAWMQDEYVTMEYVDSYVTIPRRISGRYMRIELIGKATGGAYAMEDMYMTAYSSAAELKVEPLGEDVPEMIRDINNVSIETLRECMQTVFEDGPKRDHRLWVGDLYLESLANRYSFRNFDLVKRCLYLFAGLTTDEGLIISNLFEYPEPHSQKGSYMITYSMLYNSVLLEYLKDTGDLETADDLWCVAKRQIEDMLSFVNEDYLFDKKKKSTWIFIDWRNGLDISAPVHGASIFALNQTYELACMLGRENEVKEWKSIERNMIKAARKHLYDKASGVVVSGVNTQISVFSQAWMIKAGVLSDSEGQKAIRAVLDNPEAVMPGTPYGTHYLVDAMLQCGMKDEAKEYVIDYWGGMVSKGADTFWEAYDPENDFISPYRFHPLNSYCHAWSCTPVYFIYKYPEIFQVK